MNGLRNSPNLVGPPFLSSDGQLEFQSTAQNSLLLTSRASFWPSLAFNPHTPLELTKSESSRPGNCGMIPLIFQADIWALQQRTLQTFLHTPASYSHSNIYSQSLHSTSYMSSFLILSPKLYLQPHQSINFPLERAASRIKMTCHPFWFQLPPWKDVMTLIKCMWAMPFINYSQEKLCTFYHIWGVLPGYLLLSAYSQLNGYVLAVSCYRHMYSTTSAYSIPYTWVSALVLWYQTLWEEGSEQVWVHTNIQFVPMECNHDCVECGWAY